MAGNVSFDPAGQLGKAGQGITALPVIIGLPSRVAPAPHFVIGVTTTEYARTSSQISGMPITDGDLVMKSARNPGSYSFKLIISATPAAKNQQVIEMTKIVNQIANVANTLFGSGPSLSALAGVGAGFVTTQLQALQAMKDGFQAIFALNLYMPLSAFSMNSAYLSSSWYIENLSFDKAESEGGVIVDITLKELLFKQSLGVSSVIQNLANVLLGPAVGSSVSSAGGL